MHEDDEGEVVATIGGEMSAGSFDGAGSGFGLTSCPSCGRIIDRVCSICASPAGEQVPLEDALERRAELHAQNQRERAWYKHGVRL
jgi:hypothetical protein